MSNRLTKTVPDQSSRALDAGARQKESGPAPLLMDNRPDARRQTELIRAVRTSPASGARGILQGEFATFEAIHEADNSKTPIVDNRKFNAKPTGNLGGGSGDEGLGTSTSLIFGTDTTESNINLKSNISWNDPITDKGGDKDGTSMTADPLGPDHKRGSAPGTGSSKDWVKRRVKLSKASGNHDYIAGHLLNHNLGGPGNAPENLAAIPHEINKAHSQQIEEPVKKYVNTKGGWGYYKVWVEHQKDQGTLDYASALKAQWVPYAIVRYGTTGNYTYSLKPAKGQGINMALAIPAPSIYNKQKKPKKALAKISPRSLFSVKSDFPPLLTPFGFDQLPLTPRTSLIVQFGIQNVLKIKDLQKKKENTDKEILEFRQQISEYEKKMQELEARVKEKEATIEEMELSLWAQNEQQKLDFSLIGFLQHQVGELEERLKKAQGLGMMLTEMFLGQEVTDLFDQEGVLEPFKPVKTQKQPQFSTTQAAELVLDVGIGKRNVFADLESGTLLALSDQTPSYTIREGYVYVEVLDGDYEGEIGEISKAVLQPFKL